MPSTLQPDQWLPVLREETLRLADRLNFYDLRAQQLGPNRGGVFQTAIEDLAAATEELRVTEEELRSQDAQLATSLLELEAAREQYRELFEFAPDAYAVTDDKGVILQANRAVSALVGYARTYVMGKPLAALVDSGSVDHFRARLSGIRQGDGQVHAWETQFRGRRTGMPVPVSVRVALIQDKSGRSSLRWLLRDISERKAIELRLAQLHAEQERTLRTRTMELEAVVRMRDDALAHERAARERAEAQVTSLQDALARATEEAAQPRNSSETTASSQ